MGTFERFGKIVKSNVNALLDQIEDPEKMFKQVLAELKNHLMEAELETKIAVQENKRLRARCEECSGLIQEWEEKAELALKNNNEELAREALKRKKALQEHLAKLQDAERDHTSQVKLLNENLDLLKAKVKELENKKSILIARKKQAEVKELLAQSFQGFQEKLEDQVLLQESLAESYKENLEAQFQELSEEEEQEELNEEMNALRKKITPKKT